jgi:hypothetical protein
LNEFEIIFQCFYAALSIKSKVYHLSTQFSTIDEAEEKLGLTTDFYMGVEGDSLHSLSESHASECTKTSISSLSIQQLCETLDSISVDKLVAAILMMKNLRKCNSLLNLINQLLQVAITCCSSNDICCMLDECVEKLVMSEQFAAKKVVSSSIDAMRVLRDNRKDPYLVQKFIRCLVDKRPNENESLMPLHRMPFGMIQYQIDFFSALHINQVSIIFV